MDLIGLLTLGLLLLLLVSLETSALCDRVIESFTEITFDFWLEGGGGGREGSSLRAESVETPGLDLGFLCVSSALKAAWTDAFFKSFWRRREETKEPYCS